MACGSRAAALLLLLAAAGSVSAQVCARLGCTIANSEANMRTCMNRAFGASAASKLVYPESDTELYNQARTMAYGRRALPAVVVYAYNRDDVVAAVKCATPWGYQVSTAGRRHSYEGWSIVSGYVNIDVSNMTDIVVNERKLTATAGAGNTNALLLSAVTAKGYMSLIGSCPSVGIIGYLLGGGQGDISPYVGLGADQLVAIEIVLWNGTVIRADKDRYEDALWASKGGGGGLGVITEVELKIHRPPETTGFTWLQVSYKAEHRIAVAMAWTKWLASGKADERLGGGGAMFKNGVVPGTGIGFALTFLGTWTEASDVLRNAGLLKAEWLATAPTSVKVDFAQVANPNPRKAPPGTIFVELPLYAYMIGRQICSAGYGSFPNVRELLGIPGAGPLDCDVKADLDGLLKAAGEPRNPLNVGTSAFYFLYMEAFNAPVMPQALQTGGYMISTMPERCWRNLYRAISEVAPGTPQPRFVTWLKEKPLGPSFGFKHFVHGKVARISDKSSAYPWRARPALVSAEQFYTPSQMEQYIDASIIPECTAAPGSTACFTAKVAAAQEALNFVADEVKNALESCSDRSVGRAWFYNYLPANPGTDWPARWWGDNYARLQRIKAAYDPLNFFTKPYTVQPPDA